MKTTEDTESTERRGGSLSFVSVLSVFSVVVLSVVSGVAQDEKIHSNSYRGKAPPELDVSRDGWLNAKEPLKLEKLRGRVVWLQFGFLGAGPCRLMRPHLARWDESFRKQGLVVIEVHNGDLDTLDDLKQSVERGKTRYAVAHDAAGKTCKTYGVKSYPAAFLVATDGKVVWEGFPADRVPKAEEAVMAELGKVTKEEREKIAAEIEEEGKK